MGEEWEGKWVFARGGGGVGVALGGGEVLLRAAGLCGDEVGEGGGLDDCIEEIQ